MELTYDFEQKLSDSIIIGIARGEANGEDRSQEALSRILTQLDDYSTDLRSTDRVLVQISNSQTYPLRIREHAMIVQGIVDYIGSKPRVFKLVNHEQESPTDEIRVELMLWRKHLKAITSVTTA